MSASTKLIYEVTLTIERDIVDAFDGWLADHVEQMLALPGFLDAKVFALDDDDGKVRRVTQYALESETDLESYLADNAAEMRQYGIDRFGDQLSASRRILRETDIALGHVAAVEVCLNCGATLSGQYCGNCGQRSRSRLISLWELVSEAFGDLLELDSRIWRTLVPLLIRPGQLTYEYLQGRRTSFMPPFRTYLVLSILFFLVLLFDAKEEFGILFEPGEQTTGQTDDVDDAARTKCDAERLSELELPIWLARRFTPARLQVICEKVTADDGEALQEKLIDKIPAALFVLLPLMAFILKLFYPLSRRFYVEHLLFVIHYHAFFFLMLILQMLFSRAGAWIAAPGGIVEVTLIVTSLYIPVYLYKAMRKVYGQGHLATVPKYLGLIVAYLVGLAAILGIAALLAAFSI